MPQVNTHDHAGATKAARSKHFAWLAPPALIALGWCAYGAGFDGAFLFDDHVDITGNAALRSLDSPLRVVLDQGQSGVSGRPLVALSYALNWAASPPDAQGVLDPWGWHVVNLALHILASLFLFGCVRRALRLPRFEPRFGANATALAFATAALWVTHPLTTGAVQYLGQRVESAMGMFLLASFYFALRAFAAPGSKTWPRLAVFACACGTGCKEVIAAAPLLVLFFDALFVSGSLKAAWSARRGMYCGLFATWLLIGAWVALAGGRSESVGFDYRHVGVWEYLTTQAWAVSRYARLSLWPSPLIFDYSQQPIVELARWLPHAFIVLALLALTAWGIAVRNAAAFAGLWWFVILAPSSSVLPIVTELVVEHRAYLPLAAIVLLVVIAFDALIARVAPHSRAPALVAAALVGGAGLAWMTRARCADYRSELGMWADVVAKFPENDRAQAFYGNDLMAASQRLQQEAAQASEAAQVARRAGSSEQEQRLELRSRELREQSERYDREGLAQYRRACELAPLDPSWRTNVGIWMLNHGQLDEALVAFEAALKLQADHVMALPNAGIAYHRRGAAGDIERAIELWLRALDTKTPMKAWIAQQLAPLLTARGRHAEALDAYRKALADTPDDAALLLATARALLNAPEGPARNPVEAAQLAQRAYRASGGDPNALELAAEALIAAARRQEASLALDQAAAAWRARGREAQAQSAAGRASSLRNAK